MLSADDLLVFVEVARRGRVTEAARHLRINHTTVSRHIARLERDVDQRLFDRNSDGWTLTEAGTNLLVHAEAVDAALLAAQEECFDKGSALSGRVRIIAPDGFGTYLLLPGLAELRRLHPGLVVEIMTANRHATLTPREFDVAITIERPQARAVSIQKLTDYSLAFYASPEYLASHPPVERVEQLRDHTLIWYVEEAWMTTPTTCYMMFCPARCHTSKPTTSPGTSPRHNRDSVSRFCPSSSEMSKVASSV